LKIYYVKLLGLFDALVLAECIGPIFLQPLLRGWKVDAKRS
jgi:hypothetical protein